MIICWNKSSPIFDKSWPNRINMRFYLKSDVSWIAIKVTNYFGYFCHKMSSKIGQSGHTKLPLGDEEKSCPLWLVHTDRLKRYSIGQFLRLHKTWSVTKFSILLGYSMLFTQVWKSLYRPNYINNLELDCPPCFFLKPSYRF